MKKDKDELLTVAEVARELRLHPQTIYSLAKAGKLEHIRVGRSLRIPRDTLRKK